ncbi:hypothetical protein IMSHALPRED_003636 [Imshaugia aleurites]|uniref:GPI inositol-deacylase winged helix domain-containing protein n=1 Tax=Imshaugia aleurites TaxID=172621 RepID=A0A8H3J7V7_9LECA|nr:hypothetical protein IMSHALPRED_003636 [Imshaugia aleurites]
MLILVTTPRFLLAVLQIDRICVARTIKKIKLALTSMPRELDDLYGETVEKIRRQSGEDGGLGMRVLSWVTHTKRPLLVDELAHGLAVEYDDDEGAHDELDTDNLSSSRSLVDVCAGLVIIDPSSQIIRLVHYTTQEYFDKERLHLFENAEVEISRASLTYLSYDIANTIPSDDVISDAIEEFPYLTYASLFWFLHVKEIGENAHSRPLMHEALKFVNDPAKIMFSTVILRKLLLRPRTYARVFEDIYQKRKGNVIALEAASECGLLELVEFLLDHSVGSDSALDSAVVFASAEGHAEIVTLLIERGASVQSLTGDSSNALQKACKGGHLQVAKILLQHGANANKSDRWMWTPLHHAAHGSHSGLVALLLENEANPSSQTPLGLTACHLAASRGDAETITFLLDAKYDLGLTTRDRHTPLHKAAEERHLNVCRLLLQRGSDVQAKNRDGKTALDLVEDSASREVLGIFGPHLNAALEGLPPLPEASSTRGPDVDQETAEDDPNQTLEARHRYWRRKHELEDKDTVSEIEHRRSLRELWHKAFRKVCERAKDANTNIDADTDAEPDARGLVQRRPKAHSGSSHQFTTDTDASELSFPWEVPHLRLVEPSPPPTRSSTPVPIPIGGTR